MVSITIHEVDDETFARIQHIAQERGVTPEAAAKDILVQAAKRRRRSVEERLAAYARFSGLWTKEEGEEFEKAIEDCETIDPEDRR